MVPTPQEYLLTRHDADVLPEQPLDGNRVVISGMSGLYPQSHNVKEFSDILYNKVNPVTHQDLRFKYNHPEVMQHTGSVPDLAYFDAQFFKINFRLANLMEPMSKKILEQAYQAIYDAGVNPEHLSGKKVGVYIGSCFSETEKFSFYDGSAKTGLGIPGCSKTMYANRISYWLNAKGPSMSIDEACCSSIAALEQAYSAMNRGECEAAIVGGSSLCLHPQSSVHYGRIINLCTDGKTKSFDEHADGCAKSEAINVLFLQKAKDALRVYAEVLNVKTEFVSMLSEETGPKYGFYRDRSITANFIKKFYEDSKVPLQAIEYVEAFGCAIPDADKVELQVIEDVFCKNRNEPLLIGSVMSNVGYGEAASGITAITKVLLGYHNGELAATLHCKQPRQDIVALREGRMRVVTEHQRFRRTYVGVNGMSVSGVNSHVLLHGHYKHKDLSRYKSSIPHLVTISGRHEDAVTYVLETLKTNSLDPEQLALLHNIHKTSITGHLGRGFIILQTDKQQETVSLTEKVEYFDNARKPLWFVYSGMGSQWSGMGAQLMRIPIFAAAIQRCDKVLAPKGLNIIDIITSPDASVFNNILHSFVGIAAVQIGLTDILREIGLIPDGIIGHSVGELGCAYADGCLTAEEMILAAYYRGLVSLETKFIRGSMAAVGMGYEQISQLCPPEIEVACHNGPESSTLSGPADVMCQFVAELTAKTIFAKEVPCSNIAYHSRYIASAGPGLLKYLKEAISSPKPRSERWISSSVPKSRWGEPIAKLCSAEYLTNNLLSPVLFEETSRLIPDNAVLVEVAPHGLLQAILKRSMPATCTNIPLTRRGHPDNAFLLLEAIGKLYVEGINSDLRALYPKVEMPVSTGTPFLSHMVKWAHNEKWPLQLYHSASRRAASNCDFILALQDKENAYLEGHSIRGNTLHPFAASLVLVWDTLAMILGVTKKQLSVMFEEVHLHSQPLLHHRRQLKLRVAIHRGTGRFEVLDGSSKVVTGFIHPSQNYRKSVSHKETKDMYFTAKDIYQLLRDRDYMYSGEFQSIKAVDKSMTEAMLAWQDNWVTFIDGMLQLNMLRQPHHAASLPTRIRSLCIDVKEHIEKIYSSDKLDDIVLMNAKINEELDNTRCGGVLIENIQCQNLPPVNESKLALKTLSFVSNFQSNFDIDSSLEVYLQIVSENVNKDVLTVVGVLSQIKDESVFNKINNVLNVVGVKVNYKQITRENALNNYDFNNVDLVLVQNLSTDENICQRLQHILQRDQFVVNEEDLEGVQLSKSAELYRVLCSHSQHGNDDQSELHLVRWGPKATPSLTTTISIRNEDDFNYLTSVRTHLATDQRLLVITPYPTKPGLKELISSWRKETVRNKINLITVNNVCVDILEQKVSKVELAFNVVDHDDWGGEYCLSIKQFATESKNVTLQSQEIGDYDAMNWVEAPEITGTGVTVTVHYAGLNKNDTKRANGSLNNNQNNENSFGSDFSGFTEKGERVMGIVSSGAASSQVRAQAQLLWPVPAHWSLEDAATVPLAYAQAFYCLGIKSKLYRGMTVLVHGGAGALGQAVISIALAHGCEVFTTVSDTRKKHFLLKLFPALKADHIGSSRDHSFADMVLLATKQKGCDVIISCAQAYLKNVTLKCTAMSGTCFDVSQLQNRDNYEFGLRNLFVLKNYCTVDFSAMFAPENMDDTKAINKMVSEGIARGYVRPLSRVTFEPSEVARALRLLAVSQHRGRVLLHMSDTTLQAQDRLTCSANRCHLLFCNTATFELQFADTLVARGVKKLCLYVPTHSSYLQHKVRSWRGLGVEVTVFTGDLNVKNLICTTLHDASQLGPLEGVYVTVGNEDDVISEKHIEDLDAELRKLCPELKYFAVCNVGNGSIGKAVCLQRISDQLSATMLTLPDLKDELYNDCVSLRSAVDAVERALASAHGIILTHKEREPQPSLLHDLIILTGITIPDDVEQSLTLEELGVQNHKMQLISNFLQVQYNVAFDEEQVSQLTIHAILELEKTILKLPYDDIKGLQTFFSYVDSDELLATTEMVLLPTLVNNASMRDDEFVADQEYLCIVPGMEGHYERFRLLCQRLKLAALVLQPGLDRPHETIRETAERFAKVLLARTQTKNTFYLLGYESGIFVALEMAAILEDRGLTGTVFCVGCSPDELKCELQEQLAEYETDEQLQDGVLRHMYTLMTGADTTELDNALRDVGTWPQKLDTCVRVLLGRLPHSAQYARALIECALARVKQARRSGGSAARALRAQLVLLRAAHDAPQLTSLQQHSQRPLLVHQLSTTLAHVATDLQCAAIINQHLDPAILEDFSTKNICETYLLDCNSYVASDVTEQ